MEFVDELKAEALGSFMLEVDVVEVGEVDGHFADGVAEFGAVEGVLGLNNCKGTCAAFSTSSSSMKNLVTSPFSKMRSFFMVPNFSNLDLMMSLVI